MGNSNIGFTQRHAVIHMYLWSVQVHVVRGADQGVAQLQQEFFPEFETQIPPPPPRRAFLDILCQGCWMDKHRTGQSNYFTLFSLGTPWEEVGLGLVQWLGWGYFLVCGHHLIDMCAVISQP